MSEESSLSVRDMVLILFGEKRPGHRRRRRSVQVIGLPRRERPRYSGVVLSKTMLQQWPVKITGREKNIVTFRFEDCVVGGRLPIRKYRPAGACP